MRISRRNRDRAVREVWRKALALMQPCSTNDMVRLHVYIRRQFTRR